MQPQCRLRSVGRSECVEDVVEDVLQVLERLVGAWTSPAARNSRPESNEVVVVIGSSLWTLERLEGVVTMS